MSLFKSLFCGAALIAASLAAPASANAQTLGVTMTEPGQGKKSQNTVLGLNKSTVVELSSPAADVVITNPQIADAAVQTSRRIIFRGVNIGQTNAFVFDRNGNQLLNLEIRVEPDVSALEDMIRRYVPDARVNVEAVNDGLIIDGVVDSLSQSDQVMRLASAFLGGGSNTAGGGSGGAGGGLSGAAASIAASGGGGSGGGSEGPTIVNLMSIAAKDQVMLEVRIVEMQRNVVKQLGIDLAGDIGAGDFAGLVEKQLFDDVAGDGIDGIVNTGTTTLAPGLPKTVSNSFTSANAFNIAGTDLGGLTYNIGVNNFDGEDLQSSVGLAIDALERIGVVKTLAEPNITAVSGESAKFLAGGEFPVPTGQDNTGRITIEFKPFGIGLGFTPVVLSEGNISMKISTEVSELTNQGAFQGQTVAGVDGDGNVITASTITIPALTVRRAESTVELPSGASMMMAGLISTKTKQSLDQTPGVKKLPILGALFQSRDFVNEETELVVIVTPYLVDPTQKKKLRTPADGFATSSDLKTVFFGKLNAMYGEPGTEVDSESYRAPVGFIEE